MAAQFVCVISELWGMFMFFQKGFRKGVVIYLTHRQ